MQLNRHLIRVQANVAIIWVAADDVARLATPSTSHSFALNCKQAILTGFADHNRKFLRCLYKRYHNNRPLSEMNQAIV